MLAPAEAGCFGVLSNICGPTRCCGDAVSSKERKGKGHNPMPSKTRKCDVYQLKLSVSNIRPPIWRRILVRSDLTLARLHLIIQSLMNWYNYHLYQFDIGQEEYGPPLEDDDLHGKRKSPGIRLSRAFGKGIKSILYEYDFGDGWEIRIQLERILSGLVQEEQVICATGARRGPAEDSGGPYGYQEYLDILKNPSHAEYKEIKEWIGEHFDPEDFDLKETNEELSKL
ncbi:MAG: plasmid pRiA4b ORF-3 family protein [Spirochaetia bacterium]